MWVKTPPSASRRSSAGSPAALFAIGVAYVNPDTFPIDLSILLLAGIVIGGTGSLGGMVFGALFVEFIRISWGPAVLAQRLTRAHVNRGAPGSPLVIYGIVLLLVLFVAPAGAAGLSRGGSVSGLHGAGETGLLFRVAGPV